MMAPGMRPPGPPGMPPPQGMYRDEGGHGRPPHHNVIEKGPDIKRVDGAYTCYLSFSVIWFIDLSLIHI